MSRYIDADALEVKAKQYSLGYYEEDEWAVPFKEITSAPGIDIVRCKECRHCYVDGEQVKFNACELNHNKVQSDDWFCADGEREGE